MSRLLGPTFAMFGLAAVVAAQAPLPRAIQDVDTWRIPLHTAPADPVGGEFGLWAAGPGYKASFHDGFVFYPLRGRDGGPNRPLRWRTQAVLVGGVPIAVPVPRPKTVHDAWTCRFEHGAVTEVYELREPGVEQSFVVHERPAARGELVVVGRIATELRCEKRDAEHAALVFRDATGRPLVRYGAAWAIDADGRRAELASSWDGECVRLHVPDEWTRAATFPVTIDPLTSRVTLGGSPGPVGTGEVLDSDCVLPADYRRADPGLTLVVHSREFASGDIDAYGLMADQDLGNRVAIWSDLNAGWSTKRPRCSHVARLERWVIVFERAFSSGSSGVRAYVHRRPDRSLNSGVLFYQSVPSGSSAYRPDIGGSTGFNNSTDDCLVVYEQGVTGSEPSLVRGALLHPVSGFQAGYGLRRGTAAGVLARSPTVIKHAQGTATFPWVVAWQERDANNTNDDWDLFVNRVYPDATRSLEAAVGPHASGSIDATSPRLDGDWGSYLISYPRGQRFAPSQVAWQRFDWSQGAGPPVVQSERTLRRPLNYSGRVHAVAFDHQTRSHWALVYQNSSSALGVLRVGHSGGTVESATLHSFSSGAGAGGAAFCVKQHEFTFTYANVDLGYPLYGRRMTYPGAFTTRYGISCHAGASLVAHRDPFAGDGNFNLVAGFPPGLTTTAILLAAAGSASWPIPGAQPCRGYLDSATLFTVESQSGVFHNTYFGIPLPDDPVFTGDVFFQLVYLHPGANSLDVETTNGIQVSVR